MKFIIVGANGNFSSQLQSSLAPKDYVVINKETYASGLGFNHDFEKTINQIIASGDYQYLINTVGVISKDQLNKDVLLWNYEFPKYLYEVCQKFNLKLVTLGSVHEDFENLVSNNMYLQSKFKFKEFLLKKEFINSLHFQFHTWYGGNKVHNEMFLGQVINSLRNNTILKLIDGNQKREYHHIEDDVKCLLNIISNETNGCFAISHGESFTLNYISRTIFSFFRCEDYLDSSDSLMLSKNYVDYRHFTVSDFAFRPTIEGLISYVKTKI